MSILRSRVGWGVIVAFGSTSTTFACSLVTSLSGLTGGGGGSDADASDAASPVTSEAGDGSTAATDAGPPVAPTDGAPSEASADGAIACADGGIVCDGACVDPASDPANCNGCGNVCATGLCGTSLSAPMTSLPVGWTFNGSANYDTFAPSAELTLASVPGQAGTFLYGDPIAIDAFDAQFELRIGLNGGSRCDGMGFVLEQNGSTALGGNGSGLGMAGLAGFGIELDIYNNAVCGDTSDDHVGVDDLTICDPQEGTPTSLLENDVTSVLDLADTHWHSAEITLASGAVSLFIDGNSVLSGVALPGLQTGAGYYLGFAGGTGGLVAPDGGPGGYRQEVKDIVITFPTPRCL